MWTFSDAEQFELDCSAAFVESLLTLHSKILITANKNQLSQLQSCQYKLIKVLFYRDLINLKKISFLTYIQDLIQHRIYLMVKMKITFGQVINALSSTFFLPHSSVVPFFVVIFEEHLIFKKQKYNLDDWSNRHGLPYGFAACFSFAVGVSLAVISMRYTSRIFG